ncbi:MAG: sugar phosphate isomerase/epimerase [Oscillospiraceae bacterium]
MNIGISTGCFFPLKTDKALILVGELGAKFTEIFFNTDSELEEEYVYKLKSIADSYGIKVVSIHPFTSAIETFMFFSRQDYKLTDSLKFYEKYFRACNILNCEYVVFHGCFANAEYMGVADYTRILNLLSQRAAEYGVHISQENVTHFKCGYYENLVKVKDLADENIRYVLDIKQAVRAKQDIYKIIDLVGDKLSHIHISDFTDDENSLIPNYGNFDFKVFIDYLSAHSSAQYALIEVYNENVKDVKMLKNSLDFLSFL